MEWRRFRPIVTMTIGAAAAAGCVACHRDGASGPSDAPTANRNAVGQTPGVQRLQHVVVIYLKNRSFDNPYGEFAGANGLANAGVTSTQVDGTDTPFATLPMNAGSPFPTTLPNGPFSIEQYAAATQKIPDLVHRFYQEQQQIDGGRMDKYALVSDVTGESMGFYHTASVPLAAEAANYTLCDNFFHAAFGGSFLNHFWLIAARTPVFPNAPSGIVAELDADGNVIKDGAVTRDGFAVNTLFTVNQPHPASTPANQLVPNQTLPAASLHLSADEKRTLVTFSRALTSAPTPRQ